MKKISELETLYFIEVEVIDEACNTFITDSNKKPALGEVFYIHPQSALQNCERLVSDINYAYKSNSLHAVKFLAKQIYDRGNLRPHIKEIHQNIGAEIYIDYENAN